MANRDILNSPRVQHVAAKMRLNPFGQTVVLKLSFVEFLVSERDVDPVAATESPELHELRGDGLQMIYQFQIYSIFKPEAEKQLRFEIEMKPDIFLEHSNQWYSFRTVALFSNRRHKSQSTLQ